MKCAVETCSNPLPRPGARFCSRACWLTKKRRSVVERACRSCGVVFEPTADARKAGRGWYCSRACWATASRGRPKAANGSNRAAPRTRSEWYLAHRWQDISADLRVAVGRCERCGATEAESGVSLHVHHKVDPYPTRDVGLLLARENLEVVCARCHTREHHGVGTVYTCRRCGVLFHDTPASKRAYCSWRCTKASREEAAEAHRPTRSCAVCSAPFQPAEDDDLYCSRPCAMKGVGAAKLAARPRFTCPVCGGSFSLPPCRLTRGVAEPCCSAVCAKKRRRGHGRCNGSDYGNNVHEAAVG